MSEQQYETYLTDRYGDLPYCPGCGHGVLARALNKALVKLQVDPRTTVLVTDIGCIGLTCKHFATSAFHGLHGSIGFYQIDYLKQVAHLSQSDGWLC